MLRRFLPLAALLVLSACTAPMKETRAPAMRLPPPEVTYAWARFDADGLTGSGASGVADRRTGRPVTIDDPVRLASVSKLVVALAVMRLVEEGRVDLDTDVSRWLDWRLRNPAFPGMPITLRMLLSHTSSVQDAGEAYVIPFGGSLRAVVEGGQVFDRERQPGSFFRYSNLNFGIVAAVLEKATGERFDRLVHRLVLAPLDLDACFNWTMCSDAKTARAVTLYRANGDVALDDLQGRRPDCPVFRRGDDCDLASYELGSNGALFSPQGGLRASMRDLAVIGRLLLNRGRHAGQRFLRASSVVTILRPAWTFDRVNGETEGGFYCSYGLAAQLLPVRVPGCNDDLFDGRRAFGHAGEAYNLRSGLWIDPERRIGIAFFAANNPAAAPQARTAFQAVEEWLAAKIDG